MSPPRPPATSPRSPHTPSSSTTSPTSTVPNPSTHTHAHHVQQHHTRRHWEERVQGALRYPAYGPWGMRSMGRQPSPWMGLRTAALSPPATLPATKFAMAPGPVGKGSDRCHRGVTGVTAVTCGTAVTGHLTVRRCGMCACAHLSLPPPHPNLLTRQLPPRAEAARGATVSSRGKNILDERTRSVSVCLIPCEMPPESAPEREQEVGGGGEQECKPRRRGGGSRRGKHRQRHDRAST